MNNTEFKKILSKLAGNNNFEFAFGGWFKESAECIIVLDLQKSNYGNFYQLIIKIYLQGIFGKKYLKNRDLLKDTGDIFRGVPVKYNDIFSLDFPMEDKVREEQLGGLFKQFLLPFVDKALTRAGLIELAKLIEIMLLPAIEEKLK